MNLRALCSRSQPGNENIEMKALETRSVYSQNNWRAAALMGR